MLIKVLMILQFCCVRNDDLSRKKYTTKGHVICYINRRLRWEEFMQEKKVLGVVRGYSISGYHDIC